MNIQELEEKHQIIIGESDLNYPEYLMEGLTKQQQFEKYEEEESLVTKEATKLSVEFAISVLEEFTIQYCECGRVDDNVEIESKIQELKQYLDEEK